MKLDPRPVPAAITHDTTTVTFVGHGSGATHMVSKVGFKDQVNCGAKIPWHEDLRIEFDPAALITCVGCLQFLRSWDRAQAERAAGRR